MEAITSVHRDICVSFLRMLKTLKFEDSESVEVAAQCLSAAFGVTIDNNSQNSNDLLQIWARKDTLEMISNVGVSAAAAITKEGTTASSAEAAEAEDAKLQEFLLMAKQRGFFNGVEEGSPQYMARLERAKAKYYSRQNPYEGMTADQLKTKGNELMAQSKYKDALGYYTKAVEVDPSNHIFHANRAAANIHLEDYKAAISDCEKSIALNSSYAKSFSRLGTACFYDKNYTRAIDAYRRALDLDPENQTYKDDLKAAEEKGSQQGSASSAASAMNPFAALAGGAGGFPGGFDMSSMMQIMNNPQFMQMASSFLQNPEFSGVVQSFAQQMGMQAPNPQELSSFMQNITSGNRTALESSDDPNALSTPFGRISKEELTKLQEEEIKNNPRLAAIVEDLRANGPSVFTKYMGDPEVMQLMSKFSQMFSQPSAPKDDPSPPI